MSNQIDISADVLIAYDALAKLLRMPLRDDYPTDADFRAKLWDALDHLMHANIVR